LAEFGERDLAGGAGLTVVDGDVGGRVGVECVRAGGGRALLDDCGWGRRRGRSRS